MNTVNIAIDICCLTVIATILLFIVMQKKEQRKNGDKFFLLICVSNFIMLLSDIPTWLCSGNTEPWAVALLTPANVVYFLLISPTLLFFTGYIATYTHIGKKIKRHFSYLSFFLCIMQVLFTLISIIHGKLFVITPENVYTRGDLFIFSQIIPAFMYVLNFIVIIYYRKKLSLRENLFLMSFIILPITAEIIQIFRFGTAVYAAATTFSVLLIFINLQINREVLINQREKEIAEAKIEIMLSQIKPHFLYNSLSIINHLCTKNPELAKETTQEFSRFLRANLDSLSQKNPIPFIKELEHTKTYISLEEKRFGDRLSVKYDINVSDFELPCLSLQPLAENAVRHGLIRKEEGGTIFISTNETKDNYTITVHDTGIGFDEEHPPHNCGTEHLGIQNVRSRLEAMCNGSLTIESSYGVGTTAVITIPKKV